MHVMCLSHFLKQHTAQHYLVPSGDLCMLCLVYKKVSKGNLNHCLPGHLLHHPNWLHRWNNWQSAVAARCVSASAPWCGSAFPRLRHFRHPNPLSRTRQFLSTFHLPALLCCDRECRTSLSTNTIVGRVWLIQTTMCKFICPTLPTILHPHVDCWKTRTFITELTLNCCCYTCRLYLSNMLRVLQITG